MKIIFDNIIYSLQHSGGISSVWSNLITRIMSRQDEIQFLEYDNACDNIFRKDIRINDKQVIRKNSRYMMLKRYINPKINLNSNFIFHSSYFRTSSNPNAINITTVHDFIYEYYVKDPLKRFMHCHQKNEAIRHSDYIICISENTKKDLLYFLPDTDPKKIFVIYNGVSTDYYISKKKKKTNNNIVFVGNRNGYKNFDKIIEPIVICEKELVIVGKPLSQNEIKLIESYNCKYHYAGYLSNHNLNKLYQEAFCLIYPSEYEGFGLPVIEAQKAGCPVIALKRSSIPEIYGTDQHLLLNSTSTKDFVEKIKLLEKDNIRIASIESGIRNADKYSWDKAVEEYYKLYIKGFKDKI